MEKYQRNWRRSSWRILVRSVALLLVLYVAADVSVFQWYDGNEALGIPPATAFAETPAHSMDVGADLERGAMKSSESSSHDQNPVPQCEDDGCFCCCMHVVLAASFIEEAPSKVIVAKPAKPVSVDHKHPNFSLTNPFHPPRVA